MIGVKVGTVLSLLQKKPVEVEVVEVAPTPEKKPPVMRIPLWLILLLLILILLILKELSGGKKDGRSD